jgi:hypothetical protein
VPQPEAAFKQKVIQAYRVAFPQGWYQFNAAHRRRGVPDLQFLLPGGRVVWIEAKVSPYKASKIQLAVHQVMTRAGGAVVLAVLLKSYTGTAYSRVEIVRATGYQGYEPILRAQILPLVSLEDPAVWTILAEMTS